MGVLDDIQTQYPFLAFLINDPEVGSLLNQAVNPNTTFSPQRFQAELLKTNWWQSRSEALRSWEIKANTDPASANADRSLFLDQLYRVGLQRGYQLSSDQLLFLTEAGLREGLRPDDPRIINTIAMSYIQNPRRDIPGQLNTLRDQMVAMAKNEYFIPLTDADHWAARFVDVGQPLDDIRPILAQRAASRYPHLAKEIEEGDTMATLFGGHIGTIAEELELSPAEVDLTQGQWLKVIDQYDPATSTHRPLTLSETRTLARQDDRWWQTANGRSMDAGMSDFMLKTFGRRK